MTCRTAIAAAALLLLGAVCLAQLALAGPALEAQVDRAIMFNRQLGNDDDALYGSRAVLLRGEMARYTAGGPAAAYRGYTVYVPCREHLTKSGLQYLAGAVPAVAPKGLIVELCDADNANEVALALFLSGNAAALPIYFLPQGTASQELSEVLATAAQRGLTDRVVLSVGKTLRLAEPAPNATLPSVSVEAQYVHKPKELRKKASGAAQVLVAAQFDTLGVSPASRTNGGASGAVAAMELWRRLTSTPAARQESAAAYGVTVLLGSTARFNYAGTTSWMSQHTDGELDQFKAVLCLDELLPPQEASPDAPDLYLHVQDALMKRPHGQQVVEQVEAAAKAVGLSLKVVQTKTNYQHYDLRFEHEVFASRQMAALTLSTHRTHLNDQAFRDVRRAELTAADAALLAKRVDMIEALVRTLAGAAASAAEAATASVWPGSASYMQGMLQYASESHRSPVAGNGADLRQYATTIEHHMRAQAAAAVSAQRGAATSATVSATNHRLRMPGITLFGPYTETMQVFVAKSYLFECGVAAAALVALLGFLYAEVGLRVVLRIFSE